MTAPDVLRPRLAVVTEKGASALPPGKGGFAEVVRLERPAATPADRRAALAEACEMAARADCDWLVAPSPGETLRDDSLARVAPALGAYDAVFGALHVAGAGEAVWRPSRLAFDEADRLPHALLHWWIGETHFVRTGTLEALLDDISGVGPETASLDYLFRLWRSRRCIKLAQPLLDVAEEPGARRQAERLEVLDRLARDPIFLPVAFGRETYRLPYTGRNAGIEREQTRGMFFEAAELGFLAERIGTGRHIVDIGANTGNHTVYFAGPMRAASVLPFEPLPDVAAILARTVELNGLSKVDLSRLGTGLSDAAGRARVVRSERGGLGASRLEDDAEGEIEVTRLDDALTQRPDFLKIDVESMEMRVLAGAERTIAASRPVIFIEVANDNATCFIEWLDARRYGIERIFSDKGHSNYLIAPKGG